MAAIHQIDHDNKLIITSWEGEPDDSELIEAFNRYQYDIKNRQEYQEFNELVDFRAIEGFKISSEGLKMLGSIAAQQDTSVHAGKLALVVSSLLAYGLARMYAVFRSFHNTGRKEIKVFKNKSDALEWLI